MAPRRPDSAQTAFGYEVVFLRKGEPKLVGANPRRGVGQSNVVVKLGCAEMGNLQLDATSDVLFRIKRGLAGYVSYLAACEMNAAFSEYVLYEPVLRILTARGFGVQSEVKCPGFDPPARGDFKRLDFVAQGNGSHFALEVKWARTRRPQVRGDLEKLRKYRELHQDALGFLCVFGRKSSLVDLTLPQEFRERGDGIFAEFGNTRFGCRVFQLTDV